MAEYNIGDKFVVEIIKKTDEPLAPYISGTTKNVTVYQLKGIPFMLDADTLSNFKKFEEQKKGKWIEEDIDFDTFWKCSECGFNGAMIPDNFCPRCGADMRGET